jgi:hypothetical protein
MNKKIQIIGISLVVLSVVFAIGAYFVNIAFWQSLTLGLATTLFGIGIAIFVVNHLLTSSDKKAASKPLLKLIRPNINHLHNNLFIRHLHDQLGKDQMELWLQIYQKHKGTPKAFSPEQRDKFYSAIELIKDDLNVVYDLLQEQFRELTLLLGWSFDSKITSAAFSARLSMATFQSSQWDGTDESKLKIIEAYLDTEVATGILLAQLFQHLGIKADEWQKS